MTACGTRPSSFEDWASAHQGSGRRLRMAKATIPDASTETPAQQAIVDDVRRLYQQLQALPWQERPDSNAVTRASDRYRALEAAIRALAQQYQGEG